jgi:predicted phage terminase large subunit-like protein
MAKRPAPDPAKPKRKSPTKREPKTEVKPHGWYVQENQEAASQIGGDTSDAARARRHQNAVEAVEIAEEEGRDNKAVQAVKKELAARELARRSLIALIKRDDPSYMPGWVHHDIARRLEQFSKDVVAQKSPRLILMLPPRSGKSTLASHYFPAFHLGHNPKHEVIITSHTATLAMKFSRKVRQLLRTPSYQKVFEGTQLDPDTQSLENWQTTKRGGLMAAGVGGGILGSGAHVLVIDDPVKNAEEGTSDSVKEGIWDWYATTALTRLAPGAGILVIMQRWAPDDLAGMLDTKGREGEGDVFEVVRYPAIAEKDEKHRKAGEALHPERYSLQQLEAIKLAQDPWMWSALYQQAPLMEEGDFFKREDLSFYEEHELPSSLTYYSTWDFALSKKERADWTVGIVAGVDTHGDLWVVDLKRDRWDAFEIVEQLLDTWVSWPFELMGAEEGQIKLAIGPYLEQQVDARRIYDFALHPLKPGRKDKPTRARSIQGMIRRRKVHFPREAPWRKELVAELTAFPNGVHDDQVDVLAYLGLMLQELQHIDRTPRERSPRKKERAWETRLSELLGQTRNKSWRAA